MLDSGAFHHLINDKENLYNVLAYSGNDNVTISNDSSLSIQHFGKASINLYSCALTLSHVPRKPSVSHNLISIQKLCVDNHKFVEFHANDFFSWMLKH